MEMPIEQLPPLEKLQGWTQLWEEAKRYFSYQKVFDQRLKQASNTAEPRQVMNDLVSQVEQGEPGQEDPTGVEQVADDLVNRVEAKDQRAKKITNTQRAQVFTTAAEEHIITLKEELGYAFEALGLEPPWSAQNKASGLYRTDDHAIPLAIRFLDRLRLSKSYGYVDFRVPGYIYGCPSPISRLRLAKKNGQIDAHIYDEYLANCIDELTKRIFNILANKAISDLDQANVKDIIRNQLKTLYESENDESLVEIDQNVAEKTSEFKEDFMDEDFQEFGFFEILGDIQYEFENAESLVEIDQYVAEKTSEFVADFMDEYLGDFAILSDHQYPEIEQDITDLFKSFNQERNAERHLGDCFDLAFCAKASESEKSAARLQALKENGVTDTPGVLHGASVDSAQSLYDFNGLSVPELIETAKHAVEISSYGLLKATLDVMNARNIHVADDEWIEMIYYAFNGDEPSIIKQCLDIKDESGKSLLEGCRENQQFVLLREAISADKRKHSMRINEDRLQMLLDRGVSVNAKDRWGDSVLMSACSSGYETIVSQLIKAGIDINAKNISGETALRAACKEGQEAVVTQLIEARADVNVKDKMGATALMIACAEGQEAVVSKLIEAKSDLDIVSNYGKTALMYACRKGHGEIVTQLIEAGADVNTKDSKGKTAYDYAVDRGHASLANRVIALESVGTRANRIARETGEALGSPAVLTALAGITTARMYASGSLDTALESASQAMPDIVSAASNVTAQALTELTAAATVIGNQIGYRPSL